MKKNEFKLMKNKAVSEIEKELNELRIKRVNLKFDLAAGKVKNIREIKNVKTSIAQLLTVLAERSKIEVENNK
ncbi:MAG: 50S ribosomal protein L29 [bacterium]|nr:50S ribosomal protein L29 [Candidatus Jorgensenbacteria bacterium]